MQNIILFDTNGNSSGVSAIDIYKAGFGYTYRYLYDTGKMGISVAGNLFL